MVLNLGMRTWIFPWVYWLIKHGKVLKWDVNGIYMGYAMGHSMRYKTNDICTTRWAVSRETDEP